MMRNTLAILLIFCFHYAEADEIIVERMEYVALLDSVGNTNRILAEILVDAGSAPDPALFRNYATNVMLYLSTQMSGIPAVEIRRDQICDQSKDLGRVSATFDRYRHEYSESEQQITSLALANSKQLVSSLKVDCKSESERDYWRNKLQDHKKKLMDDAEQ